MPAADRLVQDPRRARVRHHAGTIERRRLDCQRGQRRAGSRSRHESRRALLGDGDDTAPDTRFAPSNASAPPSSVQRATSAEDRRRHGSDRMSGDFRAPSTTSFHRRHATVVWKPGRPVRRRRSSRLSEGADFWPDLPPLCALKPDTRLCRGTGNRHTALGLARGGSADLLRQLEGVVRDGAGGKSVLMTMWPLLAALRSIVSRWTIAQGMKFVASVRDRRRRPAAPSRWSERTRAPKNRRRGFWRKHRPHEICRSAAHPTRPRQHPGFLPPRIGRPETRHGSLVELASTRARVPLSRLRIRRATAHNPLKMVRMIRATSSTLRWLTPRSSR